MNDRSATFQRFTATLLVALWVVQPMLAVLHSREHAHRYCPEHQTFEETTRGTGQGQFRLAPRVPVLTAVRVNLDVSPVRSSHEACPLQSPGTRGCTEASATVRAVQARLATSVLATAPPRSLSSVPILATAPKLSPPARA
jgi:hypothetical protein